MYMLQGIGSIIGAPMVGAIFDAVGSFDAGFYVAGGFFVAASFCSFAAQALQRRKNLTSVSLKIEPSNKYSRVDFGLFVSPLLANDLRNRLQ